MTVRDESQEGSLHLQSPVCMINPRTTEALVQLGQQPQHATERAYHSRALEPFPIGPGPDVLCASCCDQASRQVPRIGRPKH